MEQENYEDGTGKLLTRMGAAAINSRGPKIRPQISGFLKISGILKFRPHISGFLRNSRNPEIQATDFRIPEKFQES